MFTLKVDGKKVRLGTPISQFLRCLGDLENQGFVINEHHPGSVRNGASNPSGPRFPRILALKQADLATAHFCKLWL